MFEVCLGYQLPLPLSRDPHSKQQEHRQVAALNHFRQFLNHRPFVPSAGGALPSFGLSLPKIAFLCESRVSSGDIYADIHIHISL